MELVSYKKMMFYLPILLLIMMEKTRRKKGKGDLNILDSCFTFSIYSLKTKLLLLCNFLKL